MSDPFGPPPPSAPAGAQRDLTELSRRLNAGSLLRWIRIGTAALVTVVVGLVALLSWIEAADLFGAKSWFEENEGNTRTGGGTPDKSSLLTFGVGFGLLALYAACWLAPWRPRILLTGLHALLCAGVAVAAFIVDGSPSLAQDLSDSSKLACTKELPEYCAEGWDDTAHELTWTSVAFAAISAITCGALLALRRSPLYSPDR